MGIGLQHKDDFETKLLKKTIQEIRNRTFTEKSYAEISGYGTWIPDWLQVDSVFPSQGQIESAFTFYVTLEHDDAKLLGLAFRSDKLYTFQGLQGLPNSDDFSLETTLLPGGQKGAVDMRKIHHVITTSLSFGGHEYKDIMIKIDYAAAEPRFLIDCRNGVDPAHLALFNQAKDSLDRRLRSGAYRGN